MSVSRFENVLRTEDSLFRKVLENKQGNKYVEDILILYKELKKDSNKFESVYKIYLDFAIAIHSIYKYLLQNQVEKDKALELLSILCMNSTNKVLDRLSFIQLAFHYSTNREYLKLVIISSITTLESLELANELEEHDMDDELGKSMKDCNIEEYFKCYGVEELMDIVSVAENSFDMFLDKNFNSIKDKEDSVILKIVNNS